MAFNTMTFGTGLITINKFWTDFKAIVTSKSLKIQYELSGCIYYIYALDNNIIYTCFIFTGNISDQAAQEGYTQTQNNLDLADFTTNYMSAANATTVLNTNTTIASATITTSNLTAQITDGTNNASVKAASTASVVGDKSLVVQISPNTPAVSVAQSTAANLNATVVQKTVGNLIVTSSDGNKATYSASFTGLAPAASATDIFEILGSATKTIRILNVSISATAGTAINVPVSLIKRSTANTAGTGVVPTPLNSTSSAATATCYKYAANPASLGTAVGNVKDSILFVSTATTQSSSLVFDFGAAKYAGASAIVLNSATEALCINLNATSISSGSVSISVLFTEE